jgi:hypothetical protein
MNLLKRIVYLLDRMKLLPSLTIVIPVKYSFHILIRIARHSMTCANQVNDYFILFQNLASFLIDF